MQKSKHLLVIRRFFVGTFVFAGINLASFTKIAAQDEPLCFLMQPSGQVVDLTEDCENSSSDNNDQNEIPDTQNEIPDTLEIMVSDPDDPMARPQTVTVDVVKQDNGDVELRSPDGTVRITENRAIMPDGQEIYIGPPEGIDEWLEGLEEYSED